MKVKCVFLKGDWAELTLNGVYEAVALPSYGYRVGAFYLNNSLEVEGFESECVFEVVNNDQ